MSPDQEPENLRDRIARQGEDALGRFAQDLLENPLVSSTLSRALEARERATQAQEVAMGALNLPSAADIERLTRRLRSVSQRLEGIEDAVDRLDARLERLGTAPATQAGDAAPLRAVEAQLARLAGEVSRLVAASDGDSGRAPTPLPREQERFEVDTTPGPAPKAVAKPRAPAQPKAPAKRAPGKAPKAKPTTGKAASKA